MNFLKKEHSLLTGSYTLQEKHSLLNGQEVVLQSLNITILLRYDTIGRIELIPSIVLSSNNTNCKNDIQLFLQLFDELSVYRDYH